MIPYWIFSLLVYYLFRCQLNSNDDNFSDKMLIYAGFMYVLLTPGITLTMVAVHFDNPASIPLQYVLILCYPGVLVFIIFAIIIYVEAFQDLIFYARDYGMRHWFYKYRGGLIAGFSIFCFVINNIFLFISVNESGKPPSEKSLPNFHFSNCLTYIFLDLLFLQGVIHGAVLDM